MKTMKFLFIALLSVVLFSCVMPGPEGPIGPKGEDGVNIVGKIIDVQGDFLEKDNYKIFYQFPSDLEIYSTDIVLVYILWETAKVEGKDVDIWRLLPQTVVLNEGVLQYNYDYTLKDVNIFLEGSDLVLNSLTDAEKYNQVFRIAIMPAADLEAKSIDVNDINAVAKSAKINLGRVPKYNIK